MKKPTKIPQIILFVFLSGIIIFCAFILFVKKKDQEKFKWNSSNDSFSTDLIVGEQGHIYLNATVNGISGIFLFDTGAGISTVNEKLVLDNEMKLNPFTIWDANGFSQTKNLYKIKSFELEAIGIEGLQVYPADSLSWTNPKDTFYGKDSIIGTIGNNIIPNYIWDFDLKNQRVTVSNNEKYCHNLPDSLAIGLVHENNHKKIPALINGEHKMLALDFGCSYPLVLSDTIPSKNKFKFKGFTISQNSKTAFSHADQNKSSYQPVSFVDIHFGNNKFNRVRCVENSIPNLFGIPFIWAFERVVLNYKNDKIYFISESDSVSTFGVKAMSKRNFESFLAFALKTNNGKAELALRNDMKMPVKWISRQNDTLNAEYIYFGDITVYGGRKDAKYYSIDSIAAVDSLILPNGFIKHGPYTVNHTEKYHFE